MPTPSRPQPARHTADRAGHPVPWDGAPWTPRRWQAQALPAVLGAVDARQRAVVSAVMGAGKSVLIAELVHQRIGEHAVVVTTPTQALVDQLADTLAQRVGPDLVGRYFTHAKDADRPVVVACNASAPALAEVLDAQGRRVGLWIADEVHRTETSQMIQASRALRPGGQIGFTATPFRSDGRQKLRLWDTVVFRYSLADALNDQVLVPWTVIPWDGEGDEDLDAVCTQLIRRHADGPGMVNAADIADAEHFAGVLRSHGMAVDTVHSRRPAADNTAALEALEIGDLDCIVHVNMLAEGIDLPWLRWLCLRRPVSARVRFIQEVGRVLRASPGKDRAILLDPHDLFGAFGWHLDEALGEWEKVTGPPREPVEREPGGERLPVATDPWTAYCRRLLLPLQAAGWATDAKVSSDAWRRDLPTPKQLKYLRVCRNWRPWTLLPGEHAQVMALLLSHTGDMTRGAVSDLIAVSRAVTQHRGYPVDADAVDLPPPFVVQELSVGRVAGNGDPRWYVAGVWQRDCPKVALVVFHGGRVVRAWTRQRRPDHDWTALQVSAIAAALHIASLRGEEHAEVATMSALAAAIANGEAQPRKRAILEAERTLRQRARSISFRAVEVSSDDNSAPFHGFRALRQATRRAGPEAP